MVFAATSAQAIGIVLGTILIVAFSIWRGLMEVRVRTRTLTEGARVVGSIVQANSLLFEPGTASAPALVLISFDARDGRGLEELAADVARLKTQSPSSTLEKVVCAIVRDETYRPNVRVRLPLEFTNGVEVYAVNVWIQRSHLPEGRLTQRSIVCRALPGNQGPVFMDPPRTTREG